MKISNGSLTAQIVSCARSRSTRSFPLPQRLCLVLLLALFTLSAPVFAADLSFTGNLPNDDAVQLFEFTISAPADVTLRTYSYAGGTNSAGQTIPAGGFDPILSVFNSSGVLIDANDDGAGVPSDPVSGSSFDTLLVMIALPAGDYTAAVSQFSNFATGPNLSDGFNGSGTSGFVDVGDFVRTSAWAFDVLNVDSADQGDTIGETRPSIPVPTLSEWMLITLALLLAAVGGLRMRSKSA